MRKVLLTWRPMVWAILPLVSLLRCAPMVMCGSKATLRLSWLMHTATAGVWSELFRWRMKLAMHTPISASS